MALLAVALLGQSPFFRSISEPALDAIAPIQNFLTSATGITSGGSRSTSSNNDMLVENVRLRGQVDKLTQDAARAPELQRENDELRELLGLRRSGARWQLVEGRIVSLDSTNQVKSAVINRGTRDGVSDGMTAITSRGLAGRIVRVGANWSQVLLANDPSSSANAVDQRSRARGVVSGLRAPSGTSVMQIRLIPQGEDVKVGDRIITSGLGGVFPEGISIGLITQVRQRETDLFQEAMIEPYVDYARIETMMIILNHVPIKLDFGDG